VYGGTGGLSNHEYSCPGVRLEYRARAQWQVRAANRTCLHLLD
jgi:hypothetical protein